MVSMIRFQLLLFLLLAGPAPAAAQYVTGFEGDSLSGWTHDIGDGQVEMSFLPGEGSGIIHVDASRDRHNIWWALIRRDVSGDLDLNRLQQPNRELRVEAHIRVSHAPRRVNLSLNTQRTTNFHRHLMEFDIPDTTHWHTISMTTDGFDGRPGDTVNAQLALIDWGRQQYHVEVDSFAVSVVNPASAPLDEGTAVPYPLPIRDPDSLAQHVPVAHDGMIHRQSPETPLADWRAVSDTGRTPLLTVSSEQLVLFRWASDELPAGRVQGPGVLELTAYHVQRAEAPLEELGQVRVVEILGGRPRWTGETVTFNRFTQGGSLHDVLNPQMIVDVDVAASRGQRVRVPISEPVLQRLVDEDSRGIALRPLGPIVASFYSEEADSKTGAMLHLTVQTR